MSVSQTQVHTMTAISTAIDGLRDMLCSNKWKSFKITHNGVEYTLDKSVVNRLRRDFNSRLIKTGKSSGRKKVVTDAEKGGVVSCVMRLVEHSLSNVKDVKVSKPLLDSVLSEVSTHINKLPARKLKKTLFRPRLLYVIDDHFKSFIENISLSLLSTNMTGKGNASLRNELTKLEDNLLGYFTKTRVNASTVLNALLNHYTKVHDLRKKEGSEVIIRLDDNLKALVNSPMDSKYNGKSLADKYKASDPEKKKKIKNDDGSDGVETVESLAGFREAHPDKSVKEYLSKHPIGDKKIPDGFISVKSIMAIVSGHIIPENVFPEESEKFNMEMKDDLYVNPHVNALLAVQAMISSTLPEAFVSSDEPARSVTRSPSRAPSVSRGRRQ